MKPPRFLHLVAVCALGLTAAACDDDDDDIMTPSPTTAVSLRVVHASPDAPAVDVYVEGNTQPLFTDLQFGEVSAFLDVPEGTYNVQIRGAGSAPSSAPVFETGDLSLTDGDVITAVAAGFLTSNDPADRFRVLPLFERFDAAATGSARVRIVHASPDAPTVAIDVGNDGTPEVASIARFADTGESGVDLPAGSALQIGIWAGNPLARVTAFTTPALPAGAELFVIAVGTLDALPREADGFGLLAVGASGAIGLIKQNPVVYALHAGPDAPAVDIFASDLELVDNISFGELTGPIQVPPAAYTLDFFGHAAGSTRPAGAPAGSFDTPALESGQRYLAIATGFLSPDAQGEQPFTLVAFRDDFEVDPTVAKVRAIHASPDAPPVDIGTVSGNQIDQVVFDNIAFPSSQSDAGTEIPAAPLTIGVAPTGQASPVATFDITAQAGLRAFAVAIGALAPDTDEEAFRLLLVNTAAAPWTATAVNPN